MGMGTATPRAAEVVRLPATGRDAEAIVAGLRRHAPEAATALYHRVAHRVNQLVWRLLGADSDHDDVVHQVFASALASVESLRDPTALDGWMVGITVNTVRHELRRRRLHRLLRLEPSLPEPCSGQPDPERHAMARRFYTALDRLGAATRIAFTLRMVEGCTLPEVATACSCSLATAKRRIARATRYLERVRERDPVLAEWLRSGQP